MGEELNRDEVAMEAQKRFEDTIRALMVECEVKAVKTFDICLINSSDEAPFVTAQRWIDLINSLDKLRRHELVTRNLD